jgi:cytochrome c biogenesis protein
MVWNALKQVWRFLTRLNVAAVIIIVVLSLAALGSCFPQLSPSVAADAERLARWETGVRARYGPLTDLLAAIGAFRWFHSPLFLAPLALLILTTLVCTLDRWRAVWRRAFRSPVRPSDLVFDAAPHTASLTGPTPANSPRPGSAAPVGMLARDSAHTVRERLRRQGFRVRSETAGGILYLRGDRNRLASLATLVTHLAVLLLLLGTVLSIGYGWREELSIGPGETAEVGHGSRLALRNDGFSIARHSDGSVASYDAEIAVIAEGQEVARGGVRVNQPLTYGGVGLYLSGYGERESGYSVTLLAVHDPGYGLVVAAGFTLLLGLTVSFNFPRCWIQARIESDGSLDLAGWAERRAYDFGREFKALVEEFSRSAGTEGEGAE